MGLSDGDHRSVPEFNQKDLVDAIVKGYYGEKGYNSTSQSSTESASACVYYDIHGRKLSQPTPGLNIVRMSDGSVRKILQGN